MQVETAVGFWCESLAFAQVGVFRNNCSQGLNFKHYASPFLDASAELVLEAFSVDLGAPGAPQMAAEVEVWASVRFIGEWGGAGTGLARACFQGLQALTETGSDFGAALPTAVLRTKPIMGRVRFRFFFVFGAARLGFSQIFFAPFPWVGA